MTGKFERTFADVPGDLLLTTHLRVTRTHAGAVVVMWAVDDQVGFHPHPDIAAAMRAVAMTLYEWADLAGGYGVDP